MIHKNILIVGALIFISVTAVYAAMFFGRTEVAQAPEISKEENTERITEPPIPIPESDVGSASIVKKNSAAEKNPADKNANSTPPAAVCSGSNFDQLGCYRSYLNNLVLTKGAEAALDDVRARYADPFVYSQCHQLTHIIGRAAAGIYPTISEAFVKGDGLCWSGYYHGVMEGVLGQIKKEDLGAKLDSICRDIRLQSQNSFDHYNCVHGLGHGVMAITQNELFESLKLCDNLSDTWERLSCWSGAFMENIIADEINHVAKYLKQDDPLYPCSAVEDKYKNTCYLMQTSRMLALVGQDFKKVFELCSTVGEPYIDTCYQSLGRDASGRTVSNSEKTRATCLLGKNYREQSNCVIGAVKDFISYYHSDTQAREFCSSLPEESLRSICFSTAENYYRLF